MWPAGTRRTATPSMRCLLAIVRGFEAAGGILAKPRLHDLDGFGGREHGAVAGAGVIAMAVRDDGAFDRRAGSM